MRFVPVKVVDVSRYPSGSYVGWEPVVIDGGFDIQQDLDEPCFGGIDTTDFGPGFQVVHLTGIVETLMLNTATPIDEEHTDVSFAYTVNTEGDEKKALGVGAAIIKDLEKQMSEDIPIWENKKYYEKPMLCDGDGQFGLYRRWMSQFFENATTE